LLPILATPFPSPLTARNNTFLLIREWRIAFL
jgi:hypothetical protein